MNKFFTVIGVMFFAGLVLSACSSQATPQEVEQMCAQLTKLRSSSGGEPAAPSAEEIDKCKKDPMVKDVSSEVAACRIKAADVDTFWNKCR